MEETYTNEQVEARLLSWEEKRFMLDQGELSTIIVHLLNRIKSLELEIKNSQII